MGQYKYHVFVCTTGKTCSWQGGPEVHETLKRGVHRAGLKGAVRVNHAGCMNQCGHGPMVVVYPEGSLTREPDLWPMRGKTGAVRIALERDIPIVPAAHWGTQALLPRYGKKLSLFPRKTIDVIIGEPLDLSAYRGKPLDQASLLKATGELMDAIAALLAELRGEPAPAAVIDSLFVAAYARHPSEAESQAMLDHIADYAEPNEGYAGILWALLNSSEFALNH